MKLEELQVSLDLRKWHDSENNAKDMCRSYDFCNFCNWDEDLKCAKAYVRMEEAAKKQKPEAKKVAPAKKPVAAKPAAKATTAKAAPAKAKAAPKKK